MLLSLGGCAAPAGEKAPVNFVTAIGMPFYIALKMPVCAATLVAAGPLDALEAFAASSEQDSAETDARFDRQERVADRCGVSEDRASY